MFHPRSTKKRFREAVAAACHDVPLNSRLPHSAAAGNFRVPTWISLFLDFPSVPPRPYAHLTWNLHGRRERFVKTNCLSLSLFLSSHRAGAILLLGMNGTFNDSRNEKLRKVYVHTVCVNRRPYTLIFTVRKSGSIESAKEYREEQRPQKRHIDKDRSPERNKYHEMHSPCSRSALKTSDSRLSAP